MSNLLEKASIVTTPTAYDNGKILSVKPSIVLGSELVTNGDFATDSNWVKGTGWTISGGVATANNVPNLQRLQQGLGTSIIGSKYKYSINISNVSGFYSVYIFGVYVLAYTNTEGIIEGEFTATSTNGAFWVAGASAGGLISATIDNVSVKQVIDGDFDFTRNSSATRVNSQGLIEDMQILSSNLVSNGDFSQEGSEQITNGDFSNGSTDWNLGSGITISGGSANFTGVANANINQSAGLITGKTYKIVFTVSNYVSGNIDYNVGGNTRQGEISANGTYTVYVVSDSGQIFYFQSDQTLGFVGSIDNVSVKEVGQDWEFNSTAILTANGMNITTGGYIRQDVVTIGKSYKLTYDIFSYTSGDIRLYDGTNQGSLPTSIGSNTFNFIAGGSFTVIQSNSVNVNLVITNIKIIEITSDTNLPRINYTNFDYENGEVVPYSGEGSLLLEPQSTNLLPYSEDFSQSSWVKTDCSVVSNFGASPSGKTNASKLTFTTTNTSARAQYNLSGLTAGSTYTQSYYIKSLGTDITLRIGTSASVVGEFVDIIATSEWQRFQFTGAASSTTEFPRVQNITGTSDVEILVWGAQLEQQSYPTSYIPTEGSIKTRLADAAFGAGSSDLINSTEGVLYAEIAALANDGTYRSISISDSSRTNIIEIDYTNDEKLRILVKSANVVIFSELFVLDITIYTKLAVKYKLNDFEVFINGIKEYTITNGATPIGLSELAFDRGDGGTRFFGKTKCVAVFKEALTNEELTCLTTI